MSDMAPTAPSKWFRINLWLHRWTSLVATLPFLVLCLTGTVLIFHEEIDAAMGALPPSPGLSSENRPLNDAVENALAAYPEERVSIIGVEPIDHPGLLLIGTAPLGDPGFDNITRRYAHLSSGELTPETDGQGSLTGVLLQLHAQWFMGPVGRVIGALIALLVVISLLSAMVIYAPYVKRVAFGVLRKKRSSRLYQLDLHNFVGVIVLGWLLVVSVTGFFLGFGSIITGLWAQGQLREYQVIDHSVEVDVRRPPINADQAYKVALEAAPEGWSVHVIIWPGTDFTSEQYYAVRIAGSGINEKLFRIVLVNAITGEVGHVVELPWFIKTIALSQPLHFGDYGGLPLKILWTICAWFTLFITLNGAWLWMDKRRQRRQSKMVGATA